MGSMKRSEETRSVAFVAPVRQSPSLIEPPRSPFAAQDSIGDVDCILVSNSYWIEETRPCITYGLRGVVHVSIEVRL